MKVKMHEKEGEIQYCKFYKGDEDKCTNFYLPKGHVKMMKPVLLNKESCTVLIPSDLGMCNNTQYFLMVIEGENPNVDGYTIIRHSGSCKDTEHYTMHMIREVGKAYGELDELV